MLTITISGPDNVHRDVVQAFIEKMLRKRGIAVSDDAGADPDVLLRQAEDQAKIAALEAEIKRLTFPK